MAIFIFSIFSIKLIAKLLNVKSSILSAFVLAFCVIGSFTLKNSCFDVLVATVFGLIGYWMRKEDYPLGPMTLALFCLTVLFVGYSVLGMVKKKAKN